MKTPKGWKTDPLGHIAQLVMGQSPESKYYSELENGLPFLQGCAEFGARFPIHAIYCSQTKKVAPQNSILFSVRAPVARLNIADQPYIIGRGLASILGTGVSQDYLEHFLHFEELNFRNASQGSTFEAINSSELNKWLINYPISKHEQSKIAEILSTVDRAIEQTESLIAKQQRIKTGLMQDLLTRGIDEHGNLRSEETHEFKDSPLGRIPVKWWVSSIGQLFEQRKERGRPELPVMSIVMIYGLVERNSYERRVESNLSAESHALVRKGDIAYNMMRMWQGVLGLAPCDCLISPAYVVLKPIDLIDSSFAEWLFRDKRSVAKFHLYSRGVVDDRLRLYPKDIFQIIVALPKSLDEQKEIAKRINSISKQIKKETTALEKYRRLKVGLMQDLLKGKVRVTSLLKNSEITDDHQEASRPHKTR